MQHRHIRTLDTLRGLAALAVCLTHGKPIFGAQSLMPHAYLSVDFFFALSGFILVNRYRNMIIPTVINPLDFKGFAILRIARLYPLYLIAMIMGAGFVGLRMISEHSFDTGFRQWSGALGAGVFVLPWHHTNLLHIKNPVFPFATQSWSIFWELIVSGLFFVWVRIGQRNLGLFAAVWLAFMAAIIIPRGTIDGGWQIENFWIGGLRAIFSFTIGIMCARYLEKQTLALGATKKLVYLGYAAFILVFAYMALIDWTNPYIEILIVGILLPLVLVGVSQSKSLVFNNRLGDWLGGISYSVYLIHELFAQILIAVVNRMPALKFGAPLGIVWLLSVLFISNIIWRYFEVPAQKWVRQKLSKPRDVPQMVKTPV